MTNECLWTIGSPDGHSGQLVDNYKDPNRLDDIHYSIEDQDKYHWHLFHPREADPDSGYYLHPYTISFHLDEITHADY